ncbi:uncharacterized protein LOC118262818 isoform X1 [Spodoptera frugiperda]|uniref:Uncharacterized protein LOC118262818 isoform X1 n=1 Tax=Spodoptera frugiperda TaxID=7108 RepID=A0A9R0DTS5_SPOFR|nr:uncharacterized protein LOC118262818 isoform X1 [Spodoptera frugiperda]XP_050553301.1 uncharacterized protein LOC118262818 isoform X1 [Spodoptera frugiperda]
MVVGFKRVWDSSCPLIWDQWVDDNGTTWIIQDLPPEHDEEAIKILVENLCPDETLCSFSKITEDPVSIRSISDFWRGYLAQRMSLACYEVKDGRKKLVALNVCLVQTQGEEVHDIVEGKGFKNLYAALKVIDEKIDAFKYLGMSQVLYALGLVVCREYRGSRLGARILAARKPLSLHHGVKATSTVFTGPASQISATRAGFTTIGTVSMKEFFEHGLNFPNDDNICVKVMVKRFDD